jgi:ECF sigma factor
LSTQIESQKQKQNLELEWRRSKVLELNSQGYSQPETAKILQVSLGTVNRDLSIIRQQARKNMQEHLTKRLPDEYNRCLTGLNQVLKTCWYIVNKPGTDDRTKLQATAIINDSYKYAMDLVTNGSVITDAIKHVSQIQKDVDTINKIDKSLEAIEEETTTNGVF